LLRKARTDGERRITFEPARRPEVASLLTIAGLFLGEDPAVLAEQIGDGGSARLKEVVTDAVNDGLGGLRRRRAQLAEDRAHVRNVLRDGNERATAVAEATLRQVRAAMGMEYR
jgi:tryptophanyl-tRNA synthetase